MNQKTGGRPRTHGGEARMDIAMTRQMKAAVVRAAHASQMTASEFARAALSRAVKAATGEEEEA